MNFRAIFLLAFCLLFSAEKGQAQEMQPDSSLKASRRDSSLSFFGVPLVFYSPDTRWGIGAAGIITFPTRPRRSNLTFNFSYTQYKQILVFFPFQWLSNRNRFRVYGEAGWYSYLYRYFGVGNQVPNDYLETYTAKYPRIRVTGALRAHQRNLLGIRWFYDDFDIVSSSPGGEIALGKVHGAGGGRSSSIGPVWISDARDNAFYPRKGWLAELSLTVESRLTGSDFSFVRCSLDVSRYIRLGQNVLALHGIAMYTAGDVPFFQYPQIGGPRRLRGYPDGKYRDRDLLLAQAELRIPLFWRFKLALFGGCGSVFGQAGESAVVRPNGGAGLRIEFDRRQQLHLRIDYGIGKGNGNSGFYATVGEAF